MNEFVRGKVEEKKSEKRREDEEEDAFDRMFDRLGLLHRKALEAAMKISEEEKKLIRDLIESSYRIIYLGHIPVHYRFEYST